MNTNHNTYGLALRYERRPLQYAQFMAEHASLPEDERQEAWRTALKDDLWLLAKETKIYITLLSDDYALTCMDDLIIEKDGDEKYIGVYPMLRCTDEPEYQRRTLVAIDKDMSEKELAETVDALFYNGRNMARRPRIYDYYGNQDLWDKLKGEYPSAMDVYRRCIKRLKDIDTKYHCMADADKLFDTFCFDRRVTPADTQEKAMEEKRGMREDLYDTCTQLALCFCTFLERFEAYQDGQTSQNDDCHQDMDTHQGDDCLEEEDLRRWLKNAYPRIRKYVKVISALYLRSGDFKTKKPYADTFEKMGEMLDMYHNHSSWLTLTTEFCYYEVWEETSTTSKKTNSASKKIDATSMDTEATSNETTTSKGTCSTPIETGSALQRTDTTPLETSSALKSTGSAFRPTDAAMRDCASILGVADFVIHNFRYLLGKFPSLYADEKKQYMAKLNRLIDSYQTYANDDEYLCALFTLAIEWKDRIFVRRDISNKIFSFVMSYIEEDHFLARLLEDDIMDIVMDDDTNEDNVAESIEVFADTMLPAKYDAEVVRRAIEKIIKEYRNELRA